MNTGGKPEQHLVDCLYIRINGLCQAGAFLCVCVCVRERA